MKRIGSDVSKSGREDNTTRAAHPQFGFTMSAGEVRPDFRERHTLFMCKGNRCQRTDGKKSNIFYLLLGK